MKISTLRRYAATLFAALCLSVSGSGALAADAASAITNAGCVNSHVIGSAMITDVCWECVFPIVVAGAPISGTSRWDTRPPNAAFKPLCMCWNGDVPSVGVQTSFWEPNRLMEYQHLSGCMSALNGVRLPTNYLTGGRDQSLIANPRRDQTFFRQYHYYSFPIMTMLDMWFPANCNPGAFHDLDVMYISELDATWQYDELAYFMTPEAALTATPLGVAACIPDALTSAVGKPIERLYWCAGSWGEIYPLSGAVSVSHGLLHATSLEMVKTLAALHRRGFEWATVGNENMCGGRIAPFLPKAQYRASLLYPIPENHSNHAIGETDLIWGTAKTYPEAGEIPIYLLWRWLDCCNT